MVVDDELVVADPGAWVVVEGTLVLVATVVCGVVVVVCAVATAPMATVKTSALVHTSAIHHRRAVMDTSCRPISVHATVHDYEPRLGFHRGD